MLFPSSVVNVCLSSFARPSLPSGRPAPSAGSYATNPSFINIKQGCFGYFDPGLNMPSPPFFFDILRSRLPSASNGRGIVLWLPACRQAGLPISPSAQYGRQTCLFRLRLNTAGLPRYCPAGNARGLRGYVLGAAARRLARIRRAFFLSIGSSLSDLSSKF